MTPSLPSGRNSERKRSQSRGLPAGPLITSYSAAINASTLSTSAFFAFGQSGCDAIERGSGCGGGGGGGFCAAAPLQHSAVTSSAENIEFKRTETPPGDSP